MKLQASEQTFDGMLEQLAVFLTKTDNAKPLPTMDFVENILGALNENIHADYLEKRVKQLGELNERQNEEIYRQAGEIEKLKQAMKLFVRIIEDLRADAKQKDKEMKELQDEMKRLRTDFDAQGQVEMHSLADCISLLERYPVEQNKEVNKLKSFLFSLYENPTKEEHDLLSSLGMKERGPLVQFEAPVYEVKDNKTVNIKK